MTLVSRDCCPYLDDYEPSYSNPAAAAVNPASEKSVTWDPDGPMYDEPKPRRKKRVRPPGRHPHSDDADSDNSSFDDDIFDCLLVAPTDQANDLHRRVGSRPLTAAGAPSWTVVGKPNPQPVRLSQQGIEGILQSLHDVVLQPSSGRGKSGKELCLGLSYTNHAPYAHPKNVPQSGVDSTDR